MRGEEREAAGRRESQMKGAGIRASRLEAFPPHVRGRPGPRHHGAAGDARQLLSRRRSPGLTQETWDLLGAQGQVPASRERQAGGSPRSRWGLSGAEGVERSPHPLAVVCEIGVGAGRGAEGVKRDARWKRQEKAPIGTND